MNKLVYDIGASNIKFALMTLEGEILVRRTVPTPRESLEAYFSALTELAEEYLNEADGAAFSTNGRMFPDGDTYRAYTMSFLTGVNLREEMEKRLQMPVVVENDGVAATLGEWWKGAGEGKPNVLGIVLGSGMGSGLILDGRPVRGAHNNSAMTFGMLTSVDTAKDAYVLSGIETAFPMLLYKIAMAKQVPPMSITGPQFFEMAESGDPTCLYLLDGYCKAVAVTAYNSFCLLDLDAVVITGGLAEQPLLYHGIEEALKKISTGSLQYEGMDLTALGIDIEKDDFKVPLRQGILCRDANLYGALYRLVTR